MHCIDVAYSVVFVSLCLFLSLLGTWVSPAKTYELIEVPFGELMHAGQRTHVLLGVEILPGKGAICSKRDHSVVSNGVTCDAAFHQNSLNTCL